MDFLIKYNFGMSGNKNKSNYKIANKKASDAFDKLIFEQGLRAKQVLLTDKKLDTLVVLLNNGVILRIALSSYPKLKKASQAELEQWELIADGIGIRWNALDEDLSIKGMIK